MDLSRLLAALSQGCIDPWAATVHWKDSPSPPAAPDYAGAAKATAAGNRVNQYTPYGSQVYSQSDPTGNPDQYNQTITLNPQVQQALDSQMGFSNQMGDVAQQALPRVQQSMQSGFDQSQVPGLQSNVAPLSPEIANQARDAAYSQATSRLDPQFQQSEDMRRTALVNQGFVAGTEGYDTAMRDFNFAKNDAYSGARNMAYGQGLAAQNQEFGQGMQNAGLNNATSNQAVQQQAYLRGLPLNEFNALRTGAQVSTPQFGPTPGGPNYNAATAAQGAWDQGLYNQQAGAANSFNSGLMGMAGTGLGYAMGGPFGAAAGKYLFGGG